jgi:hypothetical protein
VKKNKYKNRKIVCLEYKLHVLIEFKIKIAVADKKENIPLPNDYRNNKYFRQKST